MNGMRGKIHFTNFPKPRRSCVICHQEFAPKAEIHSSIVDEAEEKFKRIDCCPACFEHQKSQIEDSIQEDKTHWKLVKPEERVNKKLSWKELDERAFLLLEEALAIASDDARQNEPAQEGSPEASQEASLLALHLLRRKKIALEREDAEGAVYRIIDTGMVFTLPKMNPMTAEQQGIFQRKLFAS